MQMTPNTNTSNKTLLVSGFVLLAVGVPSLILYLMKRDTNGGGTPNDFEASSASAAYDKIASDPTLPPEARDRALNLSALIRERRDLQNTILDKKEEIELTVQSTSKIRQLYSKIRSISDLTSGFSQSYDLAYGTSEKELHKGSYVQTFLQENNGTFRIIGSNANITNLMENVKAAYAALLASKMPAISEWRLAPVVAPSLSLFMAESKAAQDFGIHDIDTKWQWRHVSYPIKGDISLSFGDRGDITLTPVNGNWLWGYGNKPAGGGDTRRPFGFNELYLDMSGIEVQTESLSNDLDVLLEQLDSKLAGDTQLMDNMEIHNEDLNSLILDYQSV